MKTSLSVWSVHQSLYAGELDNAGFIEFAAAAGAEGVELLSVFWQEDGQEAERITAALAKTGLALACYGACNNLAVADEAERRVQLQDILTSVDRAALFGAKVVRVFSGNKEETVDYTTARGWIIAGLREAAAYAGERGITLCLENHGLFAGKAEQVQEIIAAVDSPHLRSTFDTGNFLLVDQEPEEALAVLLPLVQHVHLKDFAKIGGDYGGTVFTSLAGERFTGYAPGEGSVPLPSLLRKLKDAGYDGWLSVEYEGDEDQMSGSVRSIRNLQGIMERL